MVTLVQKTSCIRWLSNLSGFWFLGDVSCIKVLVSALLFPLPVWPPVCVALGLALNSQSSPCANKLITNRVSESGHGVLDITSCCVAHTGGWFPIHRPGRWGLDRPHMHFVFSFHYASTWTTEKKWWPILVSNERIALTTYDAAAVTTAVMIITPLKSCDRATSRP